MTAAPMPSLSTVLTLSEALCACPLIAVLRRIGADEVDMAATTCTSPS
jgi:hypothetical protein